MTEMGEINLPLFPNIKGGAVEKANAETLEIQKKFLHDIASPLAIVQGMVEIVLNTVEVR